MLRNLQEHLHRFLNFRLGHFVASGARALLNPKIVMIETAMAYAANCRIEGDYLEFGVYQGMVFSEAYHFSKICGLDHMRFYAFDSFEGLPQPSGIDADEAKQFHEGQVSCSLQQFGNNLRARRVDMSRVEIVPGWYDRTLVPQTVRSLPLKKAALVWIDCDLYESTVPVLNFITDYLQDGAVVMFDDWFCYKGNPQKGEQRAFGEWLNRNKKLKVTEYHKFGWHGNSFLIHRQ